MRLEPAVEGAGRQPTERLSVLLVRSGLAIVALPIREVGETLRPLPVEPLARMPPFLLGLAVIRGAAVPVVDLNALLSGQRAPAARRFITLRTGGRPLALAVEDVVGFREVEADGFADLPAALQDGVSESVAAVRTLDERLLLVLQASRRLADEVERAVAAGSAG